MLLNGSRVNGHRLAAGFVLDEAQSALPEPCEWWVEAGVSPYAVKDDPQPQPPFALGFFRLKPAPCRPSM